MYEKEDDEYKKLLKYHKTLPYAGYLKTKHWKHFRKEAIIFYQNKCQLCGLIEDNSYNLHLHHNSYKNRGRETFNDVILLCSNCHQDYHNK
ncbi:MAG: HNH endonuclease [Candidatus Marithrix sp.]